MEPTFSRFCPKIIFIAVGNLLKTLVHDELNPYSDGTVSINKDGVLAVPYWGSGSMFKLFKIM